MRLRRGAAQPTLAAMKEVPISGVPAVPDPKAPIPRQIRYIIGNEGCERFSFYGMRNILTVFLVTSLLMYLPEAERASAAKDVFHTFVVGVYFFPLLGGWLADRFFGKYNTIFWLSLVYCVGQLCLALFVTNRLGFYVGLSLIAHAVFVALWFASNGQPSTEVSHLLLGLWALAMGMQSSAVRTLHVEGVFTTAATARRVSQSLSPRGSQRSRRTRHVVEGGKA